VIYWDVPYEEGKLEVVGMDKDHHQTCQYLIQSSGRPYFLSALSDLKSIKKDKGLAQIVVQVVDKDGIPVMISEDEITCTIEGPAKLLGMEASNNTDMGDYTDNVQRVYHGRLIAYIQATGKEGKINIKFSAPWLKDGKVSLEAN
jgi:hypothetical protein